MIQPSFFDKANCLKKLSQKEMMLNILGYKSEVYKKTLVQNL